MAEDIKDIVEQLTKKEKEIVDSKNLNTPLKIIPLLLKRICPENVHILASLIKQSVIPSICPITDNEIDQLFAKIEKEPNLLFKKEIQDKIEEFINKRFERDKKVVIEKTSDISKLVLLMEEYLNDAITSNGSGSKIVLNIKEKIESININENGLETLTSLQKELVNAAISIEKEMNNVTTKLESGKTKVQELEEKVKTLEDELNKTKIENMRDPLTSLLTKKSFNDEIKRIESSYNRINTQYAVIFFDLDHFKKINDTYGHECGDVVLSTFGKILNKSIRDHDIVGRYGGEEFVAAIHFNLNRELLQFLKRIKTIVTENCFIYKEQKIKVTFSAGVTLRSSYDSYENALQKADMLLYKAKESGRNKIILENGMEI
ncbi:MAG: GGDEF domain-containing protein [Aliarcobacter sp.]|jgi:diguanylate cyclase (GGDEF)-like protein|nr:GGDEF domain-containing protein [Aliarcobacter sp.]